MNRVMDHVARHLTEPLPLDRLARVAGFSPHHFHRVFRAVAGETVHDHVLRVRLDRAVALLAGPRPPSCGEVALRCGFSSPSEFSRAFRRRHGVAPSRFRAAERRAEGRVALVGTLPGPPAPPTPTRSFPVRVRDLPARRVAYLRVLRPYAGDAVRRALERLLGWAEHRGFADGQWLGWQWEDPELVPLDACRYDAGVEVPADARWPEEDGISVQQLPAMTVAEVAVVGTVADELQALDALFGAWLPRGEWLPADLPCFEAWDGRPRVGPGGEIRLRVQLPIVAAR